MTTLSHPKAQLAPGTRIVRDMPFDEYCADPALNASLTKHLLTSPAHYQAAREAKDTDETIAQRMGKMVHAFVLTGEEPKYVIRPDFRPLDGGLTDLDDPWNGNKKWCKEWKRVQTLPIFTPDEARAEMRMCNAIADDELACRALAACPEREVSLFAEYRGVPVKARFDAASFEHALILDLKKARDGSPSGFGRAVHEYRYLLSAAWYRTIFALVCGPTLLWPTWAWLVVEDSAAACVTLYRPSDEQLLIGERQMDRAIDIFLDCQSTGKWPGYSGGQEMPLELPPWAKRERLALT